LVLLNSEGEEVNGLSDNGDNTAIVNPLLLETGVYTVEYSYVDDVTFFLRETFEVEALEDPLILMPDNNVYCENEEAITMSSSISPVVFEGPGVSLLDDEYIFDPSAAEIGNNTILVINSSERGCVKSNSKTIKINPVPELSFEFDKLCLNEGDTVFFDNTTRDEYLIESWAWDFDDPESGERNTSERQAPWHVFTEAGNREVLLTGETERGCIDSVRRNLNFEDVPQGYISWDNECFIDESEVSFTFNKTSISPVENYQWAISDTSGNVRIYNGSESITHSFEELNAFSVELIAETANACSQTFKDEIHLKPVINISETEDYLEDFTRNDGMWSIDEADSSEYTSWDYDLVDFANLGTDISEAWYTDLSEEGLVESSWLKSPCFNFENSERPMIALDIYRSMIKDTEGVVIESTTDGGKNWKVVGGEKEGINWYNSESIEPGPGEGNIGWTGEEPFTPDNGWVDARHDIDSLAGETSVQFRIAFSSKHGENAQDRDGFAFDNFRVREKERMILLEHFTNTSSSEARDASNIVNDLYTKNFKDIVKLEYHTSFPGQDPFNEHNSAVPAIRSLYYDISRVPYSLINGGHSSTLKYDHDPELPSQEELKAAALEDGYFRIDIDADYSTVNMAGEVDITALEALNAEERIIQIVVYEKLITGVSTLNGSSSFLNVVKDMLPNSAGTAVFDSWAKGETRTYPFSWDYSNVYDPEMVRVAVFVQNEVNRKVYQAATDDETNLTTGVSKEKEIPWLNIYPNPAEDFVFVRIQNDYEREYEIEFYDQVGRNVIKRRIGKFEDQIRIELDKLDRGVYYVRVYDRESRALLRIGKVIVMN
jgi:hypothetical protein